MKKKTEVQKLVELPLRLRLIFEKNFSQNAGCKEPSSHQQRVSRDFALRLFCLEEIADRLGEFQSGRSGLS